MTLAFSAQELADKAGVSSEQVDWLTRIGILQPREPGAFRFSDILMAALLEAGSPLSRSSGGRPRGHPNLYWMDAFYPDEPGPRSRRTLAEFSQEAGRGRGSYLASTRSCGCRSPTRRRRS